MSLIQVVTLSTLVAAKSAFAYPHPHSALYKRGAGSLSAIGVEVVAIVGALLGVGTCSEFSWCARDLLNEMTHYAVLLVYLVMHVPSWYRNWGERRRTAQIMSGLPTLQQPHSVNASVTVMGGSEVASTITKFGRTPLGGTPTFVTPVLSRAATRDTHAQPQASPPITSAPIPETQNTSIPSIAVTPV